MLWRKKKAIPVAAESYNAKSTITEQSNANINNVAHWKDGQITHFSNIVPMFTYDRIPDQHVEQFSKKANDLLQSQLLDVINITPQLDFSWFRDILAHINSVDFNIMMVETSSHRSSRQDMASMLSNFLNVVDYTCNENINSFGDFINRLSFKPHILMRAVFSQSCLRSQNQFVLTADEVNHHATDRIIELADSNIHTDYYYKYESTFSFSKLNAAVSGTYYGKFDVDERRSLITYVHTKYFEQECFLNDINSYIKCIISFIKYLAHPVQCDTVEPVLKSLITNRMVIEDLMYFNYDANLQLEISREANGKPKFSLSIPALRNCKIHSTPSLNTELLPRYVYDENVNRMLNLISLFGKT